MTIMLHNARKSLSIKAESGVFSQTGLWLFQKDNWRMHSVTKINGTSCSKDVAYGLVEFSGGLTGALEFLDF
jgi:hypothetical protein